MDVLKMKVLAHEPPRSRKSEHYVREADGVLVALCQRRLREGGRTDKGVWTVRDKQDRDCICWTCDGMQKRLDGPPEPKPSVPCKEPNKAVVLWVRRVPDQRALAHSCPNQDSLKSHCGVVNPESDPERWWSVSGKASEIACVSCMRAEGLYPDWPPYKHRDLKRQGPKPVPESRAARDARLLEAWENTGKDAK